jgi:hypothetical protein
MVYDPDPRQLPAGVEIGRKRGPPAARYSPIG